jgi:polar amino acid transport system permease protein
MFQWNVVGQFLFSGLFIHAAWTTLWLSVVSQFAGVIIGLILALMQMTRVPVLPWISKVYIWFFRGSPLLVQLLVLYNGIPELVHSTTLTQILNVYVCALIAFSFNEGAYMAEIIRAGISSVDPGQMEAAKALGMRYGLAMRRIIIPQAIRVIVPPLGNEFNNMLKSTSLAATIGLLELTGSAQVYGSQNFDEFELLLVATFWYLVLTTVWSFIQRRIEQRLDPEHMSRDVVKQKSWGQRLIGFGSGAEPEGRSFTSH